MKTNSFQKIILVIYGCLFIYFSIVHVPFKTSYRNEIKYDTLFSNSSNVDFNRLILIIAVLSILASVLFLIFRNLKYSYSLKKLSKSTVKVIIFCFVGLCILFALIFSFDRFQKKQDNPKIVSEDFFQRPDSTLVHKDSTKNVETPPFLLKKIICTEEHALGDFNSYMKFYYPDWKIYGKLVIKEQSDCSYRIQFTTIDPHIKFEKEVIIVELSYDYDYKHYSCRTIRGLLY